MKVFFDANIVLDWLLRREPTFEASSSALRETVRLGHVCLFSAGMVNDVFYILRKALKSETLAREKTESVLSLFHLAKVDEGVIDDALRLCGGDFEDDILVATALKCGADVLVTNNVRHFAPNYAELAVCSPIDYLKQIRV